MTVIKYIFLYSFLLISNSVLSQEHDDDHEHHRDHNTYHKHNNEISFAVGLTVLPEESNPALTLHSHFLKGVGKAKRLSLGISFETIFDEHKHYTLAAIAHFSIYKGLTFSYAPGILFVKEEETFEKMFAQHVELKYEFVLNKFHLGPLIEAGYEKHGFHFMGGIHFGFDF